MAPFFGASTIVWANTIAVVLVALSVGYWFGGRLADRRPRPARRCACSCWSPPRCSRVVPIVAQPVPVAQRRARSTTLSVGAFVGSLLGVLVLVAVPVLMLGAVSPWAIRLKLRARRGLGRDRRAACTRSRPSARCVGTFLAALLLIPLVGTQRTFLAFALRARRSSPRSGCRARWLARARSRIAALLAVPVGHDQGRPRTARVIYETETTYQYARVVEQPDGDAPARAQRGPGDPLALPAAARVLTGDYWDGFLVDAVRAALGAPAARGSRSSATPAARSRAPTRTTSRDTTIDAVEIDGELFDIGQPLLRPARAPAAARAHRGRAAVPAPAPTDALRRDLRRRLPPALHPVLPDDAGVLRARARPARARAASVIINVGHPEGSRRAREGADRHDADARSRTSRATRSSRPTRC